MSLHHLNANIEAKLECLKEKIKANTDIDINSEHIMILSSRKSRIDKIKLELIALVKDMEVLDHQYPGLLNDDLKRSLLEFTTDSTKKDNSRFKNDWFQSSPKRSNASHIAALTTLLRLTFLVVNGMNMMIELNPYLFPCQHKTIAPYVRTEICKITTPEKSVDADERN